MAAASVELAALGSTALLWSSDDAALAEAAVELLRELDAVDRACSRFRDDSELASLNRAEGQPVAVSSYLFEAVSVSLCAAAATGGLVDPTIGRGLRLAGYDRTFTIVSGRDSATVRARFAPAAGWRLVELDEERRSIRIPSGVELDLGATAKALAADRAATAAANRTGVGILVSLGGDIAVAGPVPLGEPLQRSLAQQHCGRARGVRIHTRGSGDTCRPPARRCGPTGAWVEDVVQLVLARAPAAHRHARSR